MENSTPAGEHMTPATFADALGWTFEMEQNAWRHGALPLVLLSGGECSEHPQFEQFVSAVQTLRAIPFIITNGMWLADEGLRNRILAPESKVMVQVTYDPRFYPADPPPRIQDPRVVYVEELTHLIPLGRLSDRKTRRAIDAGMSLKKYPTSFNIRSLTRRIGSFHSAIEYLRMENMKRLAVGKAPINECVPSISWDGSVHAGETIECYKLGTIHDSDEMLTKALLEMQCNKCGLEGNLDASQKQAIGLPVIYGPNDGARPNRSPAGVIDVGASISALLAKQPRRSR